MMHKEPRSRKGKGPYWNYQYGHLSPLPVSVPVWVFKLVRFHSDGRFYSLQLPSGITLRLITAGRGTVRAGQDQAAAALHEVEAGDLFCAIPGTLIEMKDTADAPWSWVEWQVMGPEALHYVQALGLGRLEPVRRLMPEVLSQAIATFDELSQEFDRTDRNPYLAIAQGYRLLGLCAPAAAAPVVTPRQMLVDRVQMLLDTPQGLGMNVSELSRRLGVDRTTLLRAFEECTGISPITFLRRHRIRRAEDLLAGTELGIKAVARAAGFRNEKYFIRCFREERGVTPAASRKRRASA